MTGDSRRTGCQLPQISVGSKRAIENGCRAWHKEGRDQQSRRGKPLAPEGSRRSDQEGRLSLTGSLYERGNALDNYTCPGGLDQHRCIRPFLEKLGIWVARVEEKWDPSAGECAAGC